MRRMRKASFDPAPSWCPPVGGQERIRMKTQYLLQDFEGLFKDTEAIKSRLEKANKKKNKLTAQVKFLRRKYEYFIKNQPEKFYLLKCQNVDTRNAGPSTLKHQPQSTGRVVARRTPNPNSRPEFKPKKKNYRPKQTALPSSSAVIDLNQTTMLKGLEVEAQVVTEIQRIERNLEQYPSEEADPAANNLKPLICRDVRKEAAKTGKRKISWQDPVALWVES